MKVEVGVKFKVKDDTEDTLYEVTKVENRQCYVTWYENDKPISTGYGVHLVRSYFNEGIWIVQTD